MTDKQQAAIENSAETLYGLIHARYLLTPRGMNSMVFYFTLIKEKTNFSKIISWINSKEENLEDVQEYSVKENISYLVLKVTN